MNDKYPLARYFRYLNFDHFIAPALIKAVHWIGVIAIIGAGLGMLPNATHAERPAVSVFLLISAMLLCLLLWRVFSELWILVFGIYERLVEIRDLLARRQDSEEERPSPRISASR